ncbi:MAG: amidase [Maritimibacter sp.]
MAADWLWRTAGDLGRAIAQGEIDPVILCETYLEAMEAHDLTPRIYARATKERALEEALAAKKRAASGQRLSPLDGVPISWKDLFDTAGVATEAGSALLKGRIPDTDAEVLAQATRSGLVCLGKTHMSELAFSGLGLNPITQTPPCVHDLDAVSGGSSSGAAASVAFGLAAAGIGSDTGGSVRIPAAWNDLVGLKTTSKRLSLKGVVPLVARFDTVGPLTRNVEDAALLLSALEGSTAPDLRGAHLGGTRFLVLEEGLRDLRDGPKAGFEQALGCIQDAGAEVETQSLKAVDDAFEFAAITFTTEAYATWRDQIEAAPDAMFPEILKRFRAGAHFSGADFVAAWQRLEALRAKVYGQIAGFDAVLLPTSPIAPPNMARLLDDHDYYVSENLLALRNTRIGNLLGCAALTLPTGVPSAGITLMGEPLSEERLLRLGAGVEAALGGVRREEV